MYKPAFVFDGRNVLKAEVIQELGFQFYRIGKN